MICSILVDEACVPWSKGKSDSRIETLIVGSVANSGDLDGKEIGGVFAGIIQDLRGWNDRWEVSRCER